MPKAEAATKEAKKKDGNPDCTDPEKKCPPKEEKKEDDDFKVDKGQLTFDAEGTEGGRYHSRHAHWPGGNSGVTLGRGYDMGGRTRQGVINDLTAAGVSPGVAQQYAGGAGLKGQAAGNWVSKNGGGIPDISPAQQKSLFSKTYAEEEAVVRRISNKPDTIKKYGAVCFDNLDPKIRDSLVDLKYRGDYTPRTRGFLQKAAADNDPAAFGAAMQNRSNWGSVPPDRLNRRINYWN
jgi:hypothetical protein